jgi:hypothetical protein
MALRCSVAAIRLVCAALFSLCVYPAFALNGHVAADGPELVLRLEDGRVLRGRNLVGAQLVAATPQGEVRVRIDGVVEEASAVGGPMLLYRLSTVTAGQSPVPFCRPDPEGRRLGFPIPDGAGGWSLTCTSGAEGKCILMGYRPWDAKPGIPMKDLHRACVHMLRADYGGDDHPSTRDGTMIDIYDRFGIRTPDGNPSMAFEAAWGPDGALCVAHPRIAANVSLDDLVRRYPVLRDHVGPDACTEQAMKAEPIAILFNRSRVTSVAD